MSYPWLAVLFYPMKFPYKLIPLPQKSDIFGFSILRPIIPIKLFGEMGEFQYEVLLDSGADFCIFDAEIGEALGLDITSGAVERFSGVQDAEASLAYLHTIAISVGGKKVQIPALFSYGIAKSGYGILGQKGFFSSFTIKFDYQNKEIDIRAR